MAFTIEEKKCFGCGACAFACLFNVPAPINSAKEKYVIDAEKCNNCGQCDSICPTGAIKPPKDYRKIRAVVINEAKCNGCTKCVDVCLAKAPIGIKDKPPFEIDADRCFHCGLCKAQCEQDAISFEY